MKAIILIQFLFISCLTLGASDDRSIKTSWDNRLLSNEALRETIDDLSLRKQRFKDERNYVEWVYYRIHRKELKKYKQYSSMKETLLEGKYDCVTGSALYAIIYRELGFAVSIRESTYHIYLVVDTQNGKVLIESTDPIDGVIKDPSIISNWESSYSPMVQSTKDGSVIFETVSNKNITIEMLTGLLHFNQSVRYFNEGRLTLSMGYAEAAIKQYPSDRMYKMAALIAKAMRDSDKVDPIITELFCEKYLSESLSVATN